MNAAHRQEFCVRWNSHLGSIGAAFPQLLAGQRFVDVTLACEGHQVHCHRLVLAACSSYFESILAENPCKHPVIILPSEIKLWEIQALVDFMYKGEVNVTQAGLPQLLRCAEQLRIRGLYGSDSALNLNQLKALTQKVVAAAAGGVGGSTHDSAEMDDTATNSTSTTNSTTTVGTAHLQQSQLQQMGNMTGEALLKKELTQQHQTNGNSMQQQQQQQQQHQQLQLQQHHNQAHKQQQQQQQNHQMQHISQHSTATMPATTPAIVPNAPTADYDSADDSTSNTYDHYEEKYGPSANKSTIGNMHMHMDSTIEEDHNYVSGAAHDEDDSFGAGGADTEHETSANSSANLNFSIDASASYKRVRRSEASLAQAAKCVSKGQTFQTVSNMFNIPVSTIRFYMARKGILPKRKRGRGASTANASAAAAPTTLSNTVMSQALAQMKVEPELHLSGGYKQLNEQGAATTNII